MSENMTICPDCMGSRKANVGRWAHKTPVSRRRSCPRCLGLGKVRKTTAVLSDQTSCETPLSQDVLTVKTEV